MKLLNFLFLKSYYINQVRKQTRKLTIIKKFYSPVCRCTVPMQATEKQSQRVRKKGCGSGMIYSGSRSMFPASFPDPRCLSQIPHPIFSIPDLGSRVNKITHPGSASASKNLSILTQKTDPVLSSQK